MAAAGCDTPIMPGVMPVTKVRTIQRGPRAVRRAVPAGLPSGSSRSPDDAEAVRDAGMDEPAALCERLLAEGVPGLHFITLNRSTATAELVARLGLAARRPVGVSERVG